jgi:hypothetical protein
MRLQYSLVTEELLDSALELQSFRKEVRREISFFFSLPVEERPMGLHPERFVNRLDELERKFEASMMAFLSVAGVLQAEKDGKLLTARRSAL